MSMAKKETMISRQRVLKALNHQIPDSFKGGIEQNTRHGRLWHDLKDEFGVVWSMPDDQQLYMDISNHPLADAIIKDIADYPFPDGGDPTRFTGVREKA